ncbi:uncharacterized protein H6S33_012453 [Morchella sextelata]|uniref:uncharacterized protein n=1 Tax=Morchella sextelata TaxID=1174677 RepID=UPI001D045011|nr:uncharacterized protein H6S33_012453 [Morchella sextelata]KAH0609907.1 hypothetical protein H6S33_012453 [Morchella sextelata]
MALSNQRPIDPGQSPSGSVQRTSSRKRKSHEFLVLDEEMMEQEEKRLAERERKDKPKDTKERDVLKRQRNSNRNKGTKAKGTQTKQNEDEEDMAKKRVTTKNKAKDKHGEVTNNLRDKYGAVIHPDPHQCSLLELSSKGDSMELYEFEMPQHHGEDKDGPEFIGVPNTGERSPTLMPELWKDGERLYPHEGYEEKVTQKEFDEWVGPYFKKLTNEEKVFLEDKGDMKTPFIIPDLGLHYSKTWAEEDGLATPEDKKPSESPPPTPKDGSLPPGHSFRPLTARLFALLLPEDREGPTNTDSESANNLSGSQPDPNAYTTTMPGLEELDLVADGPTDERLAQELRYIGFFDKNTTYAWETGKKKRTGDETDEGSEDEIDEEADDDTDKESEDDIDGDTDEKTDEETEDETSEEADDSVGEKPTDEVSMRLKELQGILRNQCVLNIARKTRISGKMERHMVHQELLRRFEPLDKKINDASSTFIKKSLTVVKRFQTMNKKGAPATRRGKRTGFTKKPWPIPEPIRKTMKERKLLVRTSEAALKGGTLGALPIENTFEEMGDLLKKVEEELEASADQVMVDCNSSEGGGEEWEDEDEGGEGTKRKRKEKDDDDYYEEEEKEKGKKEEEDEEDEEDEGEDDEESESWGEDDDDDDYKGRVCGL